MVHASIYEPLTDEEWQILEPVLVPALAKQKDPNKRPRRPSFSTRHTLNSILHCITIGSGIGSVNSRTGNYPSPPTRRRLFHVLNKNHALEQIAELLNETRPMLLAQFKEFVQPQIPRNKAEITQPLTWGFSHTELPWWGKTTK